MLCGLFSSYGGQKLLSVAVHRLTLCWLLQSWSMVWRAHGLQGLQHMGLVVVVPGLWSTGSIVVAHGHSFSAARGIFLYQSSNLCLLHRQTDS